MSTQFDSHFVIGDSDIDLFLVARDMPSNEEFECLKRITKCKTRIAKIFPFLQHIHILFLEDFRLWESLQSSFIICPAYKRAPNLTLLFGEEVRLVSNKTMGTVIPWAQVRIAFEQLQADIYAMELIHKKYFRSTYKSATAILSTFFAFKNKRHFGSIAELIEYSTSVGMDAQISQELFDLPKKQFKASEEFLISLSYQVSKMLESIYRPSGLTENVPPTVASNDGTRIPVPSLEVIDFIESLDKQNLEAGYLTRSVLDIPSDHIYMVLKRDVSYTDFQKQMKSILDNLRKISIIKDKIALERSDMYFFSPDTFPILLTRELFDTEDFVNGGQLFHSFGFNMNGTKLFGTELQAPVPKENLRKHINLPPILELDEGINRIWMIYSMAHKLLSKKNVLCTSKVQEEYIRHFGPFNHSLSTDKEIHDFTRKLIRENCRQ